MMFVIIELMMMIIKGIIYVVEKYRIGRQTNTTDNLGAGNDSSRYSNNNEENK